MNQRADAAAIATVSCFDPRFPQGITFLRMRKIACIPQIKTIGRKKQTLQYGAKPIQRASITLACRQFDQTCVVSPMKIQHASP